MDWQTITYLAGASLGVSAFLFPWLKYDIAILGKNTRADMSEVRADISSLKTGGAKAHTTIAGSYRQRK